VLQSCSPTGRWEHGVAPWWELYESRGSRTVLREPRGAIPRGYSPVRSASPSKNGSPTNVYSPYRLQFLVWKELRADRT
jgi:hypothetical protein